MPAISSLRSTLLSIATSALLPLRVVCRGGDPPFVTNTSTVCSGLLVDLVQYSYGYAWNIDLVCFGLGRQVPSPKHPAPSFHSVEALLSLNSTGQSRADFVVAFSTVTSARQAVIDFSTVVMQVDFKMMLLQTQVDIVSSLTSSIVRDA